MDQELITTRLKYCGRSHRRIENMQHVKMRIIETANSIARERAATEQDDRSTAHNTCFRMISLSVSVGMIAPDTVLFA